MNGWRRASAASHLWTTLTSIVRNRFGSTQVVQSPTSAQPDCKAALWTRTFYRRDKRRRQLRLTLCRAGQESPLRRQIVVFRVRRSGARKREAVFDLRELADTRITAPELTAIVEQSFSEVQQLLNPT